MFDVGWIEMALIALIALLVIGPKELPKAMRSLAKWTRKARSLAREFQSGIDDMVRDADLEDTRKAIESAKSFDIGKAMGETIDPTGSLDDEAKELKDEMTREAAKDAGDGAGESDAAEGVTGGATEDVAEAAEGTPGGAAEGATVIEHPVKIAPPHSLTPPPEPEAITPPEPEAITPPEPEAITPKPEPVTAAADGNGSKQRA